MTESMRVYSAWRRWEWEDPGVELIGIYATDQAAQRECERLAAMLEPSDPPVWRSVPPVAVLTLDGRAPFEVHSHQVRE